MKYTWLVERMPAIQTIRQCLGIGYIDAVVKYNEIIEFLDSAEDIEKKGYDSLEFVIFGLRYERVLDFETKKEIDEKDLFEENKEDLVKNLEAVKWYDTRTDEEKAFIDRIVNIKQIGPAMG
jgi:hypothetical protein